MAPRFPQRLALALRSFLRRRTVDRELDDELQFHFEQMAAQAAAHGSPGDDARREARQRFGGVSQVKEACRDMQPLRSVEHFLKDLRFGARLLWRGPVFTIVAVLSLALGIGANTAIFSVINAVVLRPLPVEAPGELLLLKSTYRNEANEQFSYPFVVAVREAFRGRAEICGQSTAQQMQVTPRLVGQRGAPEPARVQLFSGDCFTLLRQNAQVGRLLGAADNVTPGGHPVVVLSDGYWTRRFNRSPAAVGGELLINGISMTVVGVTRPDFFGTEVEARTADIWAPVVMQADLRYAGNLSNVNGRPDQPWISQRELSWLNVMVRGPVGTAPAIADGLNLVAQQEFAQISGYTDDAELREALRATRMSVSSGAQGFSNVRRRLTTPLLVLLMMVALLLVVACANLASLLLARGTHRQREMAIRLSIGAGRARLIRQLLTESLLLALLGGAVGMLAANWAAAALVRFGDGGTSSLGIDLRVDWRVLLFTLSVTVLTGLAFGLLPALGATRVPLADTLKAQARTVAGTGRRASASHLLIAGQMAVSFLLLIVAALFGRSLQEMTRVDVGFDRQHLLAARLDPHSAGYAPGDLPELHQRLLDRLRSLPGVTSASLSRNGPFSGSRTTSAFEVEGYTRGRDERMRVQEEAVTSDYFRTLGLRIIRGRPFAAEDDLPGAPKVSIVNATMARRYFGERDPIGRRWGYGTDFATDALVIVGVVEDARYNDLKTEPVNIAYKPAAQSGRYLNSLEVRTAGDPATLVSSVAAALREVEPGLPITGIDTLDARISRSMGQERMLMWATLAFGGVALALACLGLYGTVSYAVTRRTAELGVRMALGADSSAVRWLIMREALGLVLLGLVVGLPLALLCARALRSTLYGVSALDLPAYAAAAVVLISIATLAAYLPARRASRLDPVTALRAD